MRELAAMRHRLALAVGMLAATYGAGTLGYFVLGRAASPPRHWKIADCAYTTVVMLTTVGYRDPIGVDSVPYGRLFTALLLVVGAAVVVYAVSVLTTFMVEGQFVELRRHRRMLKEIAGLSDHVVVCGAGATGRYLIDELRVAGRPLVVVDREAERLERLREECPGLLTVHGDATDDDTLRAAGVERARALAACLHDDPDNLFVVVAARQLAPSLRIAAKGIGPRAADKLRKAGADAVVSVNRIGGLRLASEIVRPEVVGFLDAMMRDRERGFRFEELIVGPESPLAGRTLAESEVSRARDVLVVATRAAGGAAFTYGPRGDHRIAPGMTLILLGESRAVEELRRRVGAVGGG